MNRQINYLYGPIIFGKWHKLIAALAVRVALGIFHHLVRCFLGSKIESPNTNRTILWRAESALDEM